MTFREALTRIFQGGPSGPATPPTPVGLQLPANLTLRPYQLEGASWLVDNKRGILADDVGIGKTPQAAAAAEKPVLIVCPSYLIWQWHDYLQEAYPNDTIAVAVGDVVSRHAALMAGADWTIVNVEMLRKYYMPERIQTVIFDEFHYLRGGDSEQGRNAYALAKRTPRVYGLTATPIYKDVIDLWHLLYILDPKEWPFKGPFIKRYAKVMTRGYAQKVLGTKNQSELVRRTRPYLLRRSYDQVGLFLPSIIEKDLVIDLDADDRKTYKDLKVNHRFEDVPLTSQGQVLHLLRRLTVDQKAKAAASLIADSGDRASAILCWYQDTAETVANLVEGICVTGSTVKPEHRAKVAHSAIAQRQPLVATIASLSQGVDLSECKNVIFVEESYVPGDMYQLRGRFQRWTENRQPIVMTYIRAKSTADTVVHSTVSSRGATTSQILKEALR